MSCCTEDGIVQFTRRLRLSSVFGFRMTRTAAAGSLTGADILIRIEKENGTSADRVELTEADADVVLSGAGLVMTVTKSSTWVQANLSEGAWVVSVYVNGSFDSGFRREAFVPDGGEVTF